MKACRSFAQGLVHEGKRGATGTGFSGGAQERAMPKPQPRQATLYTRSKYSLIARSRRPRTAQIGRCGVRAAPARAS